MRVANLVRALHVLCLTAILVHLSHAQTTLGFGPSTKWTNGCQTKNVQRA